MSKLAYLHLGTGWNALDARSGQPRRITIDILLSALENMPLLRSLILQLPNDMEQTSSSRLAPV